MSSSLMWSGAGSSLASRPSGVSGGCRPVSPRSPPPPTDPSASELPPSGSSGIVSENTETRLLVFAGQQFYQGAQTLEPKTRTWGPQRQTFQKKIRVVPFGLPESAHGPQPVWGLEAVSDFDGSRC